MYLFTSLSIYLLSYVSNLYVGLSIDLIEEPFGSHLGGILGAIWEAFGSLRLRRHLGGIWTQFKQPLRSETLRGLFNLQFYEGFLRVGVPKCCKLQYIVVGGRRQRIRVAAKAP